jgi:hypothetical protein
MLIERERARIKKRPTTKAACCCGNQKKYTHTHIQIYCGRAAMSEKNISN